MSVLEIISTEEKGSTENLSAVKIYATKDEEKRSTENLSAVKINATKDEIRSVALR
jgi:hypothetical protein